MAADRAHRQRLRVAAFLMLALSMATAFCDERAGDAQPAAVPGGGGGHLILRSVDELPSHAITLTAPGTGHAIDPDGKASASGALQLTLPIGYTLSEGNKTASAGVADIEGDVHVPGSASQGFSGPAGPMSLTLAGADTAGGGSSSITGHVQTQLWSETERTPAVSTGMLDIFDNYKRSYYLAATKRFGPPRGDRMVLEAVGLVWPPTDRRPSVDSPATWGTMTLTPQISAGGGGDDDSGRKQQQQSDNHLIAPYSPFPADIDGMLGDEWSDAGQVKLQLSNNEMLLLGAKHDGNVLYVSVGLPSDRHITGEATVDLCFAVPHIHRGGIKASDRRYSVRWLPTRGRDQSVIKSGHAGEWEEAGDIKTGDDYRTRFTATADTAGDGAWHYPVFEFAIPLWQLNIRAAGRPMIGFCAVVNLPAGRAPEHLQKQPEHKLRWPWSRASYKDTRKTDVFKKRPDLWGNLHLKQDAWGEDSIDVVMNEISPTIDGDVSEEEWSGVQKLTHQFPSGIRQTLRAAMSEDTLYVASVWQVVAGTWRDQVIDLMLDTRGDEGIYPRRDDRRLRIDTGGQKLKLSCFKWSDKAGRWRRDRQRTFDAVTSRKVTRGGTLHSLECAIPITEAGRMGSSNRQRVAGLAIETAATTAPARMAQAGSTELSAMGSGTYVTAAWGTGAWGDNYMCGVSHPFGQLRGIAEYDGSGLNLGVAGRIEDGKGLQLHLGWTEGDGDGDTGTFGAGISTSF